MCFGRSGEREKRPRRTTPAYLISCLAGLDLGEWVKWGDGASVGEPMLLLDPALKKRFDASAASWPRPKHGQLKPKRPPATRDAF